MTTIPMEVFLIEDGEKITDTFKGLISKYTKVVAPHYLAFTSESPGRSFREHRLHR